MDQSQNKMGTQKMVPLIFSMALPAMISMLINALYNIVDSIFVAKYSQDALTAVSLVFPAPTAGHRHCGWHCGRRQLAHCPPPGRAHAGGRRLRRTARRRVVGGGRRRVHPDRLFPEQALLAAFTDRPSVLNQAVQYSHIAVGLSIFVMVSVMCEKIQQATGNMIIPMCQGLTGAIINIILDPLMIFGIGPFPEMGIRGAAVATIIGQIGGMFVGIWGAFVHQKIVDVHMRGFRWKGGTVLEIYRVGLPRHHHAKRGFGHDGRPEPHFDLVFRGCGFGARHLLQAANLYLHARLWYQPGSAAGHGLQLWRAQPGASDGRV